MIGRAVFWIGASLGASLWSPAQELPTVVQQKCSVCHPAPRPTALRRDVWPDVNGLMVDFMDEAGIPITQSEFDQIEAFYRVNSPLDLAVIPDNYAADTLSWSRETIGKPPQSERPQITSLIFTDLDGDGTEDDIVVTDNNLGAVTWISRDGNRWSEKIIGSLSSPVSARPFDFEGDGDIDLAVSAMGDIYPSDQLTGSLHLLVNDGAGNFKSRVLVKGVARITDSIPRDFDGDGDHDILISLFGWRSTGGVGLLRQGDDGTFAFEKLVELNGCMRVFPNDPDGDGIPDFVALFAQQHEMIVQFANDGTGTFSNRILAQANHPSFGSSSIALRDLDGDGDEDILYTNGDMMDENPEPKPYHGLRWLENRGNGEYRVRHLVNMPGCYDAEAVDLDGDGDLDVVFSALYFHWEEHDFPALAWLENRGGFEEFVPRRIAYAPSNLANIAIGDIDGDGKPDIVGGGMHVPGPTGRTGRLTLWRQE